MTAIVRISSRSQFTIPCRIRTHLGITAGTRIAVSLNTRRELVFQLVPGGRTR